MHIAQGTLYTFGKYLVAVERENNTDVQIYTQSSYLA